VFELNGDYELINNHPRRMILTKEATNGGCLPCQNGGMGNGATPKEIEVRPCSLRENLCGGKFKIVVNLIVIGENASGI
jgi:hypothetical protein